jgi:NADPH-dependent 2,4-dienoyl-CoA reductase/sulfur reductase-like enzyme
VRRRQVVYDRIVVIGAGRAGIAAAEELRTRGFTGELAIICDEQDAPYDRPSCSKGILTGHQRPRDVMMPMREGTHVQWRLGRRVVDVDATAQVVFTDNGETYQYDGLVVATGARPVTMPGWPHGEPGVHVLHNLAGAWALRQDLRDARRVAIVGGGLTGSETACAVRSLARECVLIDSNPQVMTRAIGETAGVLVTEELHREGVELRLGRRVCEIARGRRGWQLVLDDGTEVVADVVVSTIGERPDTGWLSSAHGVDGSDGILCDEGLRVIGMENTVAAGTVARWPNLRLSHQPARCGQWIAALEQGRAAARSLLAGVDDEPVPVSLLPRFWSNQFGLRIQACGQMPAEADVSVTEMRPGRRDVARAGVLISYSADDRLAGVVAVNAPHAFTAFARALLSVPPMQPVQSVPVPISMADKRRRRLSAVA